MCNSAIKAVHWSFVIDNITLQAQNTPQIKIYNFQSVILWGVMSAGNQENTASTKVRITL